MAFNDENMYMPVAPAYGNNGFGGDGSWWILLLFILLGGWGGNGFGGYGNGGGTAYVGNEVQRGFDQSAIMNGLSNVGNGVVTGFGDVATNLCGGFAGITAAINNAYNQAELAANARAMSDMQQMNALQAQFAQCCCDNRMSTVQTQNIVQNEGNQTRIAIQEQTQAILDTMCQDKIDAKNGEILALERQLAMANLQASQVAQTAEILSKLPTTTAAGA